MDYKPHRNIRAAHIRHRKFSGQCDACGKPLCSCKAYQYTDENSEAISASAPFLCHDCYEKQYGEKIPTEIDAFKSRLLDVLWHYAEQVDDSSCDFVYRVIRLIENTD